MKKAVFAGTFDPITIGHEMVIEKASKLFDKLYIALGVNVEKTPIFSKEVRLEMLRKVSKKYPNVEVVFYDGLLVDLMKKEGIIYTVRGVRNDSDYEYENKMHLYNKSLYSNIVTLFIPCDEEVKNVSSTIVREAIKRGENLDKYLSKEVYEIISKNLK